MQATRPPYFWPTDDESAFGEEVAKRISVARDVYIAVAFAKESGVQDILAALRKFRRSSRGRAVVVVGSDFYLTEPAALHALLAVLKPDQQKCRLVLMPIGDSTFHPKVYACVGDSSAWIAIGSSNLTGGGMITNVEANCIVEVESSAKFMGAVRASVLRWAGAAHPLTTTRIAEYAAAYEPARRERERAAANAKEKASHASEQFVRKFEDQLQRFQSRAENITSRKDWLESTRDRDRRYAKIQASIRAWKTKPPSTADSLEVLAAFSSSGLSRRAPDIRAHRRRLKPFANVLFDKSLGLEERAAAMLEGESSVRGVGRNAVTEILSTLFPKTCAVVNQRSLKALKNLGLGPSLRRSPGESWDLYYHRFNAMCHVLVKRAQLRDLGHLDMLLSRIYRAMKK